jgi:hypothetical protein
MAIQRTYSAAQVWSLKRFDFLSWIQARPGGTQSSPSSLSQVVGQRAWQVRMQNGFLGQDIETAALTTSFAKNDPKAPANGSEIPRMSSSSSKNATCGSITTSPKPFVAQKDSEMRRAISICDTTGQNVCPFQSFSFRKTDSVVPGDVGE